MDTERKLFAVRGAVCCANTEDSIKREVNALYLEILRKNGIEEDSIVSVQFTVTKDLDALNPATALRLGGNAGDTPLFVSSEPEIKGALPHTVRIMITFYGNKKPAAVYLNGAEVLRPDLTPVNRT